MNEFSKSKELWDYEDFLADVLGVWDCYEQRWCEGAPLVLRFEERDIWVVGDMELAVRDGLEVVAGAPVSSDALADCFPRYGAPVGPFSECLCWRTVSECRMVVGAEVKAREAAMMVVASPILPL